MNTGHKHSDALKDVVKTMWMAGASQRAIAERVNISKNTVPGIVRRLGLKQREKDTKRKPGGWAARKITLAKPKAPPAIGPIGDFPQGETCRHIAGAPDKNFQCCGQPGFPFCEFHTSTHYTRKAPAVAGNGMAAKW